MCVCVCVCVCVCAPLLGFYSLFKTNIYPAAPGCDYLIFSGPAVLSQRFHDNRRNVPSCLSARPENMKREEEATDGDGEDMLGLECVCRMDTTLTHTHTHTRTRLRPQKHSEPCWFVALRTSTSHIFIFIKQDKLSFCHLLRHLIQNINKYLFITQ